ncbi:MAG: lasso peptide biosynthesis B2 protein [Egibacteraceae bacterium]
MTPLTAPDTVAAADLGPVTILLDLDRGDLTALPGPAGTLWAALSETGDLDAAIAATPAPPDELRALGHQLVARRLLRPTGVPRPWAPPARPANPVVTASLGSMATPMAVQQPGRPRTAARVLAVAALVCARLAVRTLRFGWLTVATGRLQRRCRRPATAQGAAAALAAVRWATLRVPGRAACLEVSLAATALLAARRRSVTWCLGVAADPVRTHAWIEVDGRPVGEPPETGRYVPIFRSAGLTE